MKAFLRPSCLMLFLVMGLGALPAAAQGTRCGSLADVLADLSRAFHESIIWEGTISPDLKLVLTSAPDGATWTALVVDGTVACLLTSGKGTSGTVRPAGEDI